MNPKRNGFPLNSNFEKAKPAKEHRNKTPSVIVAETINELPIAPKKLILSVTFLKFSRSEEHASELQSRGHLVCRLLLEKKKKKQDRYIARFIKCVHDSQT